MTVLDDLGGRLFAEVPEAAAILGWDKRRVRSAAETGEIPGAGKFGGAKWQIPTQWLREQAGGLPSRASADVVDYERLAQHVAPHVARELFAQFGRMFADKSAAT
jgi:hypothetical protein